MSGSPLLSLAVGFQRKYIPEICGCHRGKKLAIQHHLLEQSREVSEEVTMKTKDSKDHEELLQG